MHLWELFENTQGDAEARLRSLMLDYLTPLYATGVKKVAMDGVIEKLQQIRSGMVVDRDMVMTVLDPDNNEMIEKIDGDFIHFQYEPTGQESDETAAQKDQNKVEDRAIDQAKKNIKDRT